MPAKDKRNKPIPPGAWSTLSGIYVQVHKCSNISSHCPEDRMPPTNVAMAISMGQHSQWSHTSPVRDGEARFDSMIVMPIDKTSMLLILDLVDLQNQEIIGRCKIDMTVVCTTKRHRKKFEHTIDLDTLWPGGAIKTKIGVKLVAESPPKSMVCPIGSPETERFDDTRVTPDLEFNLVKKKSSFKNGRMKLIQNNKTDPDKKSGVPSAGATPSVPEPASSSKSDSEFEFGAPKVQISSEDEVVDTNFNKDGAYDSMKEDPELAGALGAF